jgi:hypothetical protein
MYLPYVFCTLVQKRAIHFSSRIPFVMKRYLRYSCVLFRTNVLCSGGTGFNSVPVRHNPGSYLPSLCTENTRIVV